MSDALLDYYQRELAFIRQLGTEFAQQYPKIAGRIRLGPDRIDDPLVARLVESCALMNSREFARSSTTTSPSWPRQCLASCTRIISRRFHRWRLFSSYPIRRRGSKRLATRFHGVSSWRVTRNWRSLTANHAAFVPATRPIYGLSISGRRGSILGLSRLPRARGRRRRPGCSISRWNAWM